MTVQDYLRAFRQRWVVIAIMAMIGLVVALVAFLLRPPQYTAQISMYVSAQVGASPEQAYLGSQLSEQRVKTYTGLVISPRVMKETVNRLRLPETPDALAGQVEATSSADSIVIDVAVTQPDPQRAAQVADTIGQVFTGLVDDLERPSAPGGAAPVAIRIVQPADVPPSPSSTSLPLTLALGLFAGLVVGAGGVLARNALDTSVRTPSDLTEITGAPNLGVIAYDPDLPRAPLPVRASPQQPLSESFRQVRTNLRFVDVDMPRKVLMLSSSVPSEGKSTTVANLAIALAAADRRVLLVEADLRRPKLDQLLGVDTSVGLTQVLSGRTPLNRAVQPWGGGVFDVLTCGPLPPNPSELLGSRQMRAVLDEARAGYDVVLVDCPPLLAVTDAAALAPATDGVVLVCRYKTNRSQLVGAVDALRAVSVRPLGTVLTMTPESAARPYLQYDSTYRADPRADPRAGVAAPVAARPVAPQRPEAQRPEAQRPEPVGPLQAPLPRPHAAHPQPPRSTVEADSTSWPRRAPGWTGEDGPTEIPSHHQQP